MLVANLKCVHICQIDPRSYGAPFGKNNLFCDPCFLSLFRPLFVRLMYRKYPTYILDKMYFKSTAGHKSLISEANFFTSRLAVQLTFKNVSGLVIEANFFSQSAIIRIVATAVLIRKSLYVAIFSRFLCQRYIYRCSSS